MAQADQTVQNATFPTVRADINDNLAALFSDSSGNGAPSVTVAYQDWIDTSGANPLWKKRNAANNAWITLGTISGNAIAFEGTLPSQSGNSGKYLSTDGTDASWASVLSLGTIITAGTAVATTSGTAIDFTGIPSWVKRVTLVFRGVSLTGSDSPLIQLGTSSGFVTSGYTGSSGTRSNETAFTAGIRLYGVTSSNTVELYALVPFENISGNDWVTSFTGGSPVGAPLFGGGGVSLSDTLTQIRVTRTGTNTFDNGSINIFYEG
jgi:hypothetical protein